MKLFLFHSTLFTLLRGIVKGQYLPYFTVPFNMFLYLGTNLYSVNFILAGDVVNPH